MTPEQAIKKLRRVRTQLLVISQQTGPKTTKALLNAEGYVSDAENLIEPGSTARPLSAEDAKL